MFITNIKNLFLMSYTVILLLLFVSLVFSEQNEIPKKKRITIENSEMVLVFNSDGTTGSLIHKATGEECLMEGVNLPAFSISQDIPYDNEIRLTYPAKPKTFQADTLYKEGNNLIVGFELTDYEAVINIKVTDYYIGFNLEKFRYKMAKIGDKRKTKIDEFIFLQLPIKDRGHFGEWLNVEWDNEVAVNLLATDQYCRIDAKKRKGYKIFQAGGENEVSMYNVGAVLITTGRDKILDRINSVEHDYNLPLGVESRRGKEYKNSTYTPRGILTINNIDEHIAFAKQAGLKNMLIYYPSFSRTTGHFKWRQEYPNGIEDLKKITQKITEAGLLPGLHIHYNKASFTDSYVTPVPDGRLNLRRTFTLSNDISKKSTIISVEENPLECTLEKGRRILKIGNELISYEQYTTEPPYRFLNCKRGILKTKSMPKEKGTLLGLLDVDTWPVFVRFNQSTSIQNEVAERIANIYDKCGFRFFYFDGAEDINPPYWYNATKAQLAIYDALKTKPVFSEGAIKTHFGWHLLTRGNAFDTFAPEDIKEATRKYPIEAMKMISNDFSSINFGWNDYVLPVQKTKRTDVDYKSPNMEWSTPIIEGETTIGTQPDMLEYITSCAAAWNSPITLVGNVSVLKKHPRTDDNLEIIRRWEIVRETDFLTEKQKRKLRYGLQEYTLLIDETGKFELVPYKQITKENSKIRAFIFSRKNKVWVVYWHISGDGFIELPIGSDVIKLYKELGEEISLEKSNDKVKLPVGSRRYIQFNMEYEKVLKLFKKAKLL